MRDVWRTGRGRGLRGGQEKGWMGYFLDDLRAFGVNADHWTNAAQDEERFMAIWIAAEKVRAGVQHEYART